MQIKKVFSKISLIILVLFMLISVCPLFKTTAVSSEIKKLKLTQFRGVDSDGTNGAYALPNQNIYKVVEGDNYNQQIFCLDMSRGFGSESGLNLEGNVDYESKGSMDDSNKNNIYSIENNNNSSFDTSDYDSIVRILNNIYVPDTSLSSSDRESEKNAFLRKILGNNVILNNGVDEDPTVIKGKNDEDLESLEDVDDNYLFCYYITEKDIEVAEQLAIWHFTNENTLIANTQLVSATLGSELGNLLLKLETDTDEILLGVEKYGGDNAWKDYSNLTKIEEYYEEEFFKSDKYIGDKKYIGLWNRFNGIKEIYKYFVEIGNNTNILINNYNASQPVTLDQSSATGKYQNGGYVAGPYKINKNENNLNECNYSAKVIAKNKNGDIVENSLDENGYRKYYIIDKEGNVLGQQDEYGTWYGEEVKNNDGEIDVTDYVNNNFYVYVRAEWAGSENETDSSKICSVEVQLSGNYSYNDVSYWIGTEGADKSQPVAIVNKTKKNFEDVKKVSLDKITGSFNIKLVKVDSSDNTKRLSGAKFKVTLPDGQSIECITDDNGEILNIPTLNVDKEGDYDYLIEEAEAPTNYKKLLTGPITAKVKIRENNGKLIISSVTLQSLDTNVTYENDENLVTITVPNTSEEFDLSLRKFITAIGDTERTDRIPDANIVNLDPNGTQETTASYVHPKTPLGVQLGDVVTYTIRIYNEGAIDGYANEITDYLPEQLTFPTLDTQADSHTTEEEINEAIEFNAKYGWILSDEESGEIKTNLLAKYSVDDPTQENVAYLNVDELKDRENGTLLKAFDGENLDYIDLKIKCIVNEKATKEDVITNIAEITDEVDKDGNTVIDRDSQTKNFPDDKKTNDYDGNGTVNGYTKGQQDDDDFEKVVIGQFDLSLRKFIEDVDGNATTGRTPEVDTTLLKEEEDTTAEYNHTKIPLTVVKGSVVTYNIRVYNEGNIDGYVQEITDYLPDELEYIEDSEINQTYRWKISGDGRTATTDYLEYTIGSTENLLKAYDGGDELDYRDVKIQCRVKDTAPYQENITNLAQITEDADSNGNEINDRDSVPNGGFELPSDEELPAYKEDESSRLLYVPGQEDDDDFEKINVVYFDLALRKIVSKAIVIENGSQVVTESNHKFEDDPEAIVKVDLGRKSLNNVTVKFEYQIRITNEGLIEGYCQEIKDYIPEGLIFLPEDNPLWTEESEGIITTDQIKDELLQPGDSRVVSVLLTWKNSGTNLGLKVNIAEISKDYNKYGTPDIDSTPDNKRDGEDDIDDAPVMLSIALGENFKNLVGLTSLILATSGIGIFLIRKFIF